MSNIERDLILFWKMNQIIDGKIADASGSANTGTVVGSAAIVEDDIFGRCLQLSGKDNAVAINPIIDFPGTTITVSCWVKSADTANKGTIFSYANDQFHNAFTFFDHNDLKIYIGKKYERDTKVSSADGQWHHIAVTWQSDTGEIIIYKDGVAAHQDTIAPGESVLNGGSLMLGQDQDAPGGKTDPKQAFVGELANLRLYQRVLSAAEIEQVMLDDVNRVELDEGVPANPAQEFTSDHPIDFQLLDDDNNNAIYIDNHHQGRNLFLEVGNVSQKSLLLDAPGRKKVGPGNHHFHLVFRPGTLTEITISQIVVDRGRWAVATQKQSDGEISLFLLSKNGRTLHPGEKISVRMSYVAAASLGGFRETHAELKFQKLRDKATAEAFRGYLSSLLEVVDLRGKITIPLHVSFVSGGAILNKGANFPHTLKIEITNASMNKTLLFKPEGSEAPSRFILTADVQPPGQRREWALGKVDEVSAIQPAIDNLLWGMVKNDQGEAPEWIFTPTEKTRLKPAETLTITLSNVISSLPSGTANVYLAYEHIPGYREGQFLLPVEKGPLVIKDIRDGNGNFTGESRLGINTTNPRSALDTGRGLISGSAHDYYRAQWTMSGGGTVSWEGAGGGLKWTQRFIAISMEKPNTFSSGYVNIPMPATIPAQHVYNNQARATGANGIILNRWEALYAVHEIGQNHTAVSYRIVHYASNFYAPGNWLLVAVVNGDDNTVKLGTGLFLSAGSTTTEESPIPVGMIMMWSGQPNTIPDGWALCNGQNGTPNLLNRFIVAAGGSYGVGATGGADSVTLNVNQMPVHGHSASVGAAGAHFHWIEGEHAYGLAKRKRRIWGQTTVDMGFGGGRGADPNDVRWRGSVNTDTTGNHSHSISLSPNGGSQPHENRPLYYALCFIMKV